MVLWHSDAVLKTTINHKRMTIRAAMPYNVKRFFPLTKQKLCLK